MGNIEKGLKDRNIYILLNIQAAIKVLNNFQINSKLLWDCHQSLSKLAEHNTVQLVWVPGHMRIDGNEIADYLTRESSSHPLRGPEHALGISAKVARGVTGDWTNRKHEEHLQSIREQRQATGLLKNRLVEDLENCSVLTETDQE
jgi:ribonuclease HI